MMRRYVIDVLLLFTIASAVCYVLTRNLPESSRGLMSSSRFCVYTGLGDGYFLINVTLIKTGRAQEPSLIKRFGPSFAYVERYEMSGPSTTKHEYFDFKINCLFVALLCMVYPNWYFVKKYLQSKQRENICTKCAYNLTGNESGVCPECGTKVEKVS